ncbi:MAG: T9SS type A sorting domain-containing protein [Rhodothermales bacterium]
MATLRPRRWFWIRITPNPFNSETVITYTLSADTEVELSVYTVTGRLVAALVNERQAAGPHAATWHAGEASSGIYLYTLRAGAFERTRRMVLLR